MWIVGFLCLQKICKNILNATFKPLYSHHLKMLSISLFICYFVTRFILLLEMSVNILLIPLRDIFSYKTSVCQSYVFICCDANRSLSSGLSSQLITELDFILFNRFYTKIGLKL